MLSRINSWKQTRLLKINHTRRVRRVSHRESIVEKKKNTLMISKSNENQNWEKQSFERKNITESARKESNWRVWSSMSQLDQSTVCWTERVDNVEELELSHNIIHSHSQDQVRMFRSSWNLNHDEHWVYVKRDSSQSHETFK